MSTATQTSPDEPIAIIGIGCRYADARGPEEFWEIIESGRNTVRDAPQHRIELGYDIDHFYDPRPRIPGRISSRKGGFLEHPELFDPAPFGIAPRDALTMEPQQRLMVEVTWDALEDAGIVPEQIAGERVAVILGYMAEDYSRERAGVLGEEAVFRGHDVFTVGGMSHAVMSGRIAFLLGVTGPSFTLDTACSSSLIATHLACQSLRRGEADMALAGGVNLFLSPEGNIALSRSGMLSMSGACRAFDAGADGFVRSEGAGVVTLKRLSDAQANGDPIYAVIRGSGISSDGRDGGHMMAPGRLGQAQAMRDAYAQAKVDPARVQYVETHGTGTMIGDPVEIGALADIMGPGRDPEKPLRVASVKGNLGHTESASGVAGLIKACLSIQHRTLPAQLHFESPNPAIPWDDIPVKVQDETTGWPEEGPALVGVNSFGISGTNAHVVLESPPPAATSRAKATSLVSSKPRPIPRPARALTLPLSAHSKAALDALACDVRIRLEGGSDEEARDLAYSFACHRTHRPHRLAVVGQTAAELGEALDAYLEGRDTHDLAVGVAPPDGHPEVVMVFPGQGSQWRAMGASLLDEEPAFANMIERLDRAYARQVDWSLEAALRARDGDDWTTDLAKLQPILVAFEIALAELWRDLGITPARVVGQSMGEIAAAYVAGALDLDGVALLACRRGEIVACARGRGGMAVVALSREDVEDRLALRAKDASNDEAGRLEVAGVNSPSTTIVSGDTAAIDQWVAALEGEGCFARRLEVDFASHCFHMDPLLDPFRRAIEELATHSTTLPFHSTVDGTLQDGDSLGPDYWVRNLRAPVAFDDGIGDALAAGGQAILEVSPHPTLPRAVDESAQTRGFSPCYAGSIERGSTGAMSLARNWAALYVAGVEIDFERAIPGGRRTRLPLYPYQRERYWFSERSRIDQDRPRHPLLGRAIDLSVDTGSRIWEFLYDVDTAGFISSVRSEESIVAPAALFLEVAVEVAEQTWPGRAPAIERLLWHEELRLDEGPRRRVQVVLRIEPGDRAEIVVSSRLEGDRDARWQRHATARITADGKSLPTHRVLASQITLDTQALESVGTARFEEGLERSRLDLGGRATPLRDLFQDPRAHQESARIGKLMLPRTLESEWFAFHAHPLLMESVLQLGSLFDAEPTGLRLESVGAVQLSGGLGSACHARIRHATTDGGRIRFDVDLFDVDGEPTGVIQDVQAAARGGRRNEATSRLSESAFNVAWQPVELDASIRGEAPTAAKRRFVIISDDANEAGAVATELAKRGAESVFCEKAEDLAGIVRMLSSSRDPHWHVLLLALGDDPEHTFDEPTSHRAYRVASWAQSFRDHTPGAEGIWIATRGLTQADPADRPTALARQVACELTTYTNEFELGRCRFIDLSAAYEASERLLLADLLLADSEDDSEDDSEERQVAIRKGEYRVPRLQACAPPTPKRMRRPAGEENFRLQRSPDPNALMGQSLEATLSPVAGPGEVIVEVRAAGLSRADVRRDLGLDREPKRKPLSESARSHEKERDACDGFGQDFAGVVSRVGSDVTDFAAGDAVFGVSQGSAARKIAVDARRVARIPAGMDFATAASLAHPNVVAHHALEIVARLAVGERVLLDVGAGGVGHAMARLARRCGARLNVLGEMGPRLDALLEGGGRRIDPSDLMRSPSDATPERFDLIVTSADGEKRHRLAHLLLEGGRLLDLSASSNVEWDSRPLPGANRTFCAVDTNAYLERSPESVGRWLTQLAGSAAALGDPIPKTVFDIRHARRALRFMAQNRHQGRVCLELRAPETTPILREPAEDGNILLTGPKGEARDAFEAVLAKQGFDGIRVHDLFEETAEGESKASLSPDVGLASEASHWIHVSPTNEPHRSAIRESMIQSRVERRTFVSLREAPGQDGDADRAWETRLWIDSLSTPRAGPPSAQGASENAGAWLDLVIGDRIDPEVATRALDLLRRVTPNEDGTLDTPMVLMEPSEHTARKASPLRSGLDLSTASARGLPSIDDLIALAAKGSRVELENETLRIVFGELGMVLALSAEQQQDLDASRRLDALGLDSLMSLELFVGLGRYLDLDIERDWFAEIPTLREVAQTLAARVAAVAEEAAS